MAEYPSMPLFTDAYLADTLDLSTEEHGIYLLLLIIAWRRPNMDLPGDMKSIKRLLSGAASDMHGNRFNRIVPGLLERFFIKGKDGEFFQKRMRKEREFLRKTSEKQRENANKRWSKVNDNNDIADATVMPGGNAPTPTPTPISPNGDCTPIPPTEKSSRKATRIPDGWKPASLPVKVQALVDEWPPGRYDRELDGFYDYWSSTNKNPAKLDWEKTWHNRIRDQHDRIMRENGHGSPRQNGRYEKTDGFISALREAADRS